MMVIDKVQFPNKFKRRIRLNLEFLITKLIKVLKKKENMLRIPFQIITIIQMQFQCANMIMIIQTLQNTALIIPDMFHNVHIKDLMTPPYKKDRNSPKNLHGTSAQSQVRRDQLKYSHEPINFGTTKTTLHTA